MLTPTPLMRLTTGFWSFKTLAVAVELGLFTRLAGGRTMSVEQAREELGLRDRPADVLLAACASLGLLEKAGDGYRNSPMAEEFLVAGRPYYFGGQVRYCDERTYLPWHRVGEALRTDGAPTAHELREVLRRAALEQHVRVAGVAQRLGGPVSGAGVERQSLGHSSGPRVRAAGDQAGSPKNVRSETCVRQCPNGPL
jgi:hypothetical protein